jgi:hypothetical protein
MLMSASRTDEATGRTQLVHFDTDDPNWRVVDGRWEHFDAHDPEWPYEEAKERVTPSAGRDSAPL